MNMSNNFRLSVRLLIIFSLLLLAGCTSNQGGDINSIFVNLNNAYPNIWRLVTAIAYILGFGFAAKAIFSLKIYGEQRTMYSSQGSIKPPIVYLIIAAALMFSPTIYHSLLQSSFGTPYTSPLNWSGSAAGLTYTGMTAILGLVQVVGVIAFIRGLVILANAGEQNAQQGLFGKGLTHVIGGILAINIVGTKDLIWNTFFGS